MNAPQPRRRAGAALILASLAVAMPAHSQLVYHGFSRVDQSDATFVSITSADMLGLEAVPARSYSCTVAWGVRNSASGAGAALSTGSLTGAAAGSAPIDPGVQQDLHALLYGRGSGTRIAASLAPVGSSRAAESAAQTLVHRLDGLLAVAERMNPARPGIAAPTRLSAALAAFDDYLDASSTSFLETPPDALLGVHAVLTRLVNGGISNHGRPEIRAVAAGGGGLACAAVADSRHDRPQISTITDERRPFAMCTVDRTGPVQVYGLISSSNDSVAIVEGREQPLREAFPALQSAHDFAWYHAATDPVLAGQKYVKWGSPREMVPGSMAPFAEYEGVTIFTAPGVAHPGAVYVPVGGCRFHEYRLNRSSAAVRG